MSPRPPPTAGILVVGGPIARGDGPRLVERLTAVLDTGDARDAGVVLCDVRSVAADGVALDALARLALTATRRGWTIRLQAASAELEALISFAGLAHPLGLAVRDAGLGIEMRGEAEEGKEPSGVEERVDRDDAPA